MESRRENLVSEVAGGRVLVLETASRAGSVSLFENRTEVTSLSGDAEASHSVTLIALVHRLLSEARITPAQVDALVCAIGPGSFTGLRIGISTVKGLSASLNLPCVGVPTLHAVALHAGPSECTLAVLPAGRGEYFAQLLEVTPDNRVQEFSRAIHVRPEDLFRQLHGRDELVVSHCDLDGTMRSAVDLAAKDHPSWKVIAASGRLSTSVGMLGIAAIEDGRTVSAQDLSALYIRPSDPELKATTERLDRF